MPLGDNLRLSESPQNLKRPRYILTSRKPGLVHPYVIGELACGMLKNRPEILDLLNSPPEAQVPEHDEVLYLLVRGSKIIW